MGIAASIPLFAGVAGDLAGGWVSDFALRRTGNLKMSRRLVAMVGFVVAAVAVPLAAFAISPFVAVAWFGLAVFGLELVVGVAWAMTLDYGGEYSGSVSAVMNTSGNLAGAGAAVATGYIVALSSWEAAFLVIAALAALGALLALRLDASRRIC